MTEWFSKYASQAWIDFTTALREDETMVYSLATLAAGAIGLELVFLWPKVQRWWRRLQRRRKGKMIHRARKTQLKAMLAEDIADAVWRRFHEGEIGWDEGSWLCQLVGDVLTIRDLIPRNRDPLKEAIRKRLDAAGKLPAHLKISSVEEVTEDQIIEAPETKLQVFMAKVRAAKQTS